MKTTWTIMLALVAAPVASVGQAEWLAADPDYRWSFPRDHYTHPGYKTEWWYFTGLLRSTTDSTRSFGYQFTFFRVGLLPSRPELDSGWAVSDMIMGHAAITDIASGQHHFSEILYRATPQLGGFAPPGDSLVAWSRAPAGTDDRWLLWWNGTGFDFSGRDEWRRIAFDLTTRSTKPVVFQGPNGLSRKGRAPSAASQYYSFTRLATKGTLEIDGEVFDVRGVSWMDKEFGSNQLSAEQVGWDWFSLRLSDGRDVMLYFLRTASGSVDHAQGTLVSATGETTYLEPDAFRVRGLDAWKSPTTDTEYPSRWVVELPGEDLTLQVAPLIANQENVAFLVPGLSYWEGAVRVLDQSGQVVGEGYVELTGYGASIRPAL